MFEPGKLFTLQFSIKDHYGTPARGGKLATIEILFDGDYFEDGEDELTFEREPDDMGVITLKIVPPNSAASFQLQVSDLNYAYVVKFVIFLVNFRLSMKVQSLKRKYMRLSH